MRIDRGITMNKTLKNILIGALIGTLLGLFIIFAYKELKQDDCRGSANAECLISEMHSMGLEVKPGKTQADIDNNSLGACVYVEAGLTAALVKELTDAAMKPEQAKRYVDRLIYVYCPEVAP